jgi:enediyne biosynthesis protein E4
MPEAAVEIESEPGRSPGKPRWGRMLLLALVLLGVFLVGQRWWAARGYRLAMADIQIQIDNGRHSIAARKLTELLAWKSDSDQAVYLLGICEKARGRPKEAAEAWSRVPPGSPFASRAIQARAGLEIDRGRLAEAERLIEKALADHKADQLVLGTLLGQLYLAEGRVDEALRLNEAIWHQMRESGGITPLAAIPLVRDHIGMQWNSTSVDLIRSSLDMAGRSAPDDDRVWLGKANLDIRVGSFEDAANLIDACLRRRPDDVSIWRSRLNWAVATGRVQEVVDALTHVPAKELMPADLHRLHSWMAARRGDADAERQSLELLIATTPGDIAAIDRLAELEVKRGQVARADELRKRKNSIDQAEARYRKLYVRNQPTRDAAEMARLAEGLGRRFEAEVFETLAAALNPVRADLQRVRATGNRRSD